MHACTQRAPTHARTVLRLEFLLEPVKLRLRLPQLLLQGHLLFWFFCVVMSSGSTHALPCTPTPPTIPPTAALTLSYLGLHRRRRLGLRLGLPLLELRCLLLQLQRPDRSRRCIWSISDGQCRDGKPSVQRHKSYLHTRNKTHAHSRTYLLMALSLASSFSSACRARSACASSLHRGD